MKWLEENRYIVLQTFLLDSLNRVVALGVPVKNTAVRELYRKIVTAKE